MTVLTAASATEEFEEACTAWLAPGYPSDAAQQSAIVLKPADAKDVGAAVQFAVSKGLPLTVRGGGHSWRRLFVVDNGLTIDLSSMKGIAVNAKDRIAVVEGGVIYDEVLGKCKPYNLAPSWGSCGDVGTGTPLAGGLNLLSRAYGLGTDNIVGAKLVTANGSLIQVDKHRNADVLAIIRGAGTTLGVVVELTVKLHPVDPYHGVLLTASDATTTPQTFSRIIQWTRDVMKIEPRIGIELGQEWEDGKMSLLIWAGAAGEMSKEDLATYIEPLQALSNVNQSQLDSPTYYDIIANMNQLVDDIPYGSNYQVVFHLSYDQADDDFLKFASDLAFQNLPEGVTGIVFWDIVGNREGPNAIRDTASLTPFATDVDLQVFIIFMWLDPKDNQRNWDFGEGIRRRIEPRVMNSQAYVNQATFVTDQWLTSQVGGAANLRALRAMKAKLDPQNVFRHHSYVGLWPAESAQVQQVQM
ncbi:hypothetical protein WJX73_003387 [Symbiochloris irregularis]|uniref:FAD-binding PCMH-type domain-containing protein n=1 Tax=Symbiochloris irregularis TaxID=706552 RepID=A0AAW1NJI3_9CHLO